MKKVRLSKVALKAWQCAPPLDLLIDDLACAKQGKRTALPKDEVVAGALTWICVLLHAARHKDADMFTNTYLK